MGILAVSSTGIIGIFDILLLIYGVYTIYTSFQMKKTGEPAKWLVNELEIGKCKDKKGFIDAVFTKTVLFGAVTALYGVVSVLNNSVLHLAILDILCLLVFLVGCVIYVVTLNRARRKFF